MPLFQIRPIYPTAAPMICEALDPSAVLNMLMPIESDEADVFQNERYIFSVRKGPAGAWTIFHREDVEPTVSLFG